MRGKDEPLRAVEAGGNGQHGGSSAGSHNGDLGAMIAQLTDELAAAIERSSARPAHPTGVDDPWAVRRAAAFHVLAQWLDAVRRRLSDPAKADEAIELIRSALGNPVDPTGSVAAHVVDTSTAERLAAVLGDNVAMTFVWVAAGIAAQFGDEPSPLEPNGELS